MNLSETKNSSLNTLLEKAKVENRIGKKYIPISRENGESDIEYIEKLRQLALNPQFVEVKDEKQESKYVEFTASGPILNKYGTFELITSEVVEGKWGKHYILVYPDIDNILKEKEVFCRIESGCHSGFVFGDSTCDCKEQLDLAMQKIVSKGSGIIFQIHGQDGRGWGDWKMYNQKIMHETGLDTVSTAKAFYKDEPFDIRSYDDMALILKALGFTKFNSLELGTNNPNKLKDLEKHGFMVTKKESLVAENLSPEAAKNLQAKTEYYSK